MTNEYGFFSSSNGDRKYSADDFCGYFKDIFTNGILGSSANNLRVYSGGGMSVDVAVGIAYIEGRFFRPSEMRSFVLSDSDMLYDRIDRIVLRCDYPERKIYLCVIEGTPAEIPQIPDIVRDEIYFDLGLAAVRVRANVESVLASDIEDTRFDSSVCGIVTGVVKSIDTTELFAQYKAAWELLMEGFSGDQTEIVAAFEDLLSYCGRNYGENLLMGSASFDGWNKTDGNVVSSEIDGISINGIQLVSDDEAVQKSVSASIGAADRLTVNGGEKYIASVMYYADNTANFSGNIKLAYYARNSTGAVVGTYEKNIAAADIVKGKWNRIEIMSDIAVQEPCYIDFELSLYGTGSVIFAMPKLEKCGTASWSPSPNELLIKGVSVQYGTAVISGGTNRGEVTFPRAFKNVPAVFLCSAAYKLGTLEYSPCISIESVSQTEITMYTQDGSSCDISVNWIAFGD